MSAHTWRKLDALRVGAVFLARNGAFGVKVVLSDGVQPYGVVRLLDGVRVRLDGATEVLEFDLANLPDLSRAARRVQDSRRLDGSVDVASLDELLQLALEGGPPAGELPEAAAHAEGDLGAAAAAATAAQLQRETTIDEGYEAALAKRECEAGENALATWNVVCPPGTRVGVRLVSGREMYESRTRGRAWAPARRAPMVLIEGRAGGYLLTFLRALGPDESYPPLPAKGGAS